MRFPLDEQIVIGYDYGVATSYSPKHLGVDWKANYVYLHAPKDGVIDNLLIGSEGGKTIWFKPVGEKTLIRWLHLDGFLCSKGQLVKEGEKIAITGNTGMSTDAHLHEDLWPKGKVTLNFKDTSNPHDYYKINPQPMAQIKTQAKGAELRIILAAADINEWKVLCKVYGKDPNTVDETL